MNCRRALWVVLVASGCTKANPAFDGEDADETRGKDDRADDDADGTDADGSEPPDGSNESADDPPTTSASEGSTTVGMVESSGGPVECAEMIDRDWEVGLVRNGARLEIPCDTPYVLEGTVVYAKEGLTAIVPCRTGCDCAMVADPIEVHAPDLLLPVFGSGSCARVEIEWSELEDCRPVGFTLFSDAPEEVLVPVIVAGQDVQTLPAAVGGQELGFSTTAPCTCPECCAQTGIASLGLAGVEIAEGEEDHVPDLLGDNMLWHAAVFQAHVHDDCTRALSWRAIADDL